MAALIRRLVGFIRSPQAQRLARRARQVADRPANRRRLAQLRSRLSIRR